MNVILTAYFNSQVDPQRGLKWSGDDSELQALKNSVTFPLVIFTDCLDKKNTKKIKNIPHNCKRSPYFERWFAYYSYLSDNEDIEKVFCVDATDVKMVQNPFKHMTDRLYVGDEDQYLGTEWMLNNHPEPFLKDFLRANRRKKLLNGGLVGGDRQTMLSFLESFIDYTIRYKDLGITDMGLLNYLFYTKFKGKVTHGFPINSEFKKYETRSDVWFLHK